MTCMCSNTSFCPVRSFLHASYSAQHKQHSFCLATTSWYTKLSGKYIRLQQTHWFGLKLTSCDVLKVVTMQTASSWYVPRCSFGRYVPTFRRNLPPLTSILKTEAEICSKMCIIYRTTRCHRPEDIPNYTVSQARRHTKLHGATGHKTANAVCVVNNTG